MEITTGIHDNLDFKSYRSIKDWVSISELNTFNIAPSVYKHEVLDGNKKDPSKNQELGTALHTYVLEPKLFKKYKVKEKYDARTAAGKLKQAEYDEMAERDGCTFLSQPDYDKVRFAGDSLMSHFFVRKILPDLISESSLFWLDPETKVKCKGRLDSYHKDLKAIFDVKTTKSVKGFMQSVLDYGYHKQASYYLDGLATLTSEAYDDFYWLTVEMEAPYLCKVYKAAPGLLDYGQAEYKALLKRFNVCKTSNKFPGLSEDIETLDLPAWYTSRAIET